jgi:hypothetical protein
MADLTTRLIAQLVDKISAPAIAPVAQRSADIAALSAIGATGSGTPAPSSVDASAMWKKAIGKASAHVVAQKQTMGL